MKPVVANIAVHCGPDFMISLFRGGVIENLSYTVTLNMFFFYSSLHTSMPHLFDCNILLCMKCIIGVFLSVGLQGSGWLRLSLCSTAMSTASWDSFLRRRRAVFAPWSIQPARESYPASLEHQPYPAPPVLRTTRPDVEPVITATSSISVPADPALPHLWTTIWTWTWISLMLRSLCEKYYFYFSTGAHFVDSDQTRITQSLPASSWVRCSISPYARL